MKFFKLYFVLFVPFVLRKSITVKAPEIKRSAQTESKWMEKDIS